MALGQRLELKQGQSLVMTPQLQQAIKLLQLSNLELSAYVEQELERNPLLERGDSDGAGGDSDAPDTHAADDGKGQQDTLSVINESQPAEAAKDLDTDYQDLYTDASSTDMANEMGVAHGNAIDWSSARSGGSSKFDASDLDLEGVLGEQLSLRDHLNEQLQVAVSDPSKRMIGAYLIDMVDEAGYFYGELDQIAEKIGARESEIEEVLSILQTFEPSGVMARTLGECLAAQLVEKNRFDPAMATLIENLDMLARRDLAGLMRLCDVDAEDMADMIAEIRALNPKPGLVFGSDVIQPVVPDVYVRESTEGGWQVELNSETLPRVLVNKVYVTQISKSASDDEAKTYITECLNNANWLVKSLDQRARTILKVATEIVRQQDGFMVYGIKHLKPLNLKVVADAISMHESTVSRVTSNKYLSTPRGVFEFKYFFTSAIASSAGGEAHSAEAVRHRIRELIEQETAAAVLSDDRIVELLRESGVEIARRTVAKYREAMRIPSSVQRRRLKKALA